MGQVLIRQLDDAVIADYRGKAQRSGRSLEAELRDVLVRMRPMSPLSREAAIQRAAEIRAMTPKVPQTDGTLMIREDRDGFRDA